MRSVVERAFNANGSVWRSTPMPPAPRAVDEGSSDRVLLEAIACGLFELASLTAVTASAVNTLALKKPLAADAFIGFVPRESAITQSLGGWLVDTGMSYETVAAIGMALDALRQARGALQVYASDASSLGAEGAAVLHRFHLVAEWRHAGLAVLNAVNLFDGEAGDALPDVYRQSTGILNGLLQRAAAGGFPCLDLRGKPVVPLLPQRRRSSRRMMVEECRLRWRTRHCNAMVRDISSGGIGLSSTPDLREGDPIVVELDCGRSFSGIVAWARDGEAGVEFSTPLPLNDPLLSG